MTRAALAAAAALVTLALRASAEPLPITAGAGVRRGPVAVHDTTREAFTLAAPASFHAAVAAVPAGARLLTAIAVAAPPATEVGTRAEAATPATPAPSARLAFRVVFESERPPLTLWERVLDGTRPDDRRWIDVGVGLDAIAGRSGTLRFETVPRGGGAGATSWWASPELLVCDGTAPSLLLIVVDALRADHLGSTGYGRATTPHLDAFAARATRFTAAFAGGPKTVPSVPQTLTGHYFYWHRPVRGLPALLGTDGIPSRAVVNNPWVANWLRGERPGFAAVQAGDDLDARAITSAGLRFLTAAGRCPTSLYLHYLDAHTPYHVPPKYARRFIDRDAATTIGLSWNDVTRAWQQGYGPADRQRIVDLYDGAIAYTDRQLGRLVRGVARRGRLERTLVVVTADHGEELWDHGAFFHGQSLYDELLHVPLLLHLPAIGGGRTVDAVVRTIDVAPTVAAALGRPAPDGDGRDLGPLARDVADVANERLAFALVSHAEPRTPERHAVRTRTHKLIHDVTDGAIQIYDLVADPGEKRNLGPAAPAAPALQAALADFRTRLDGRGYQLRLHGAAARATRYVLDVATEPAAPVIAIDRPGLEAGDVLDFKPRAGGFRVFGTLEPGDVDHVRFDVLASVGGLRIGLRLDGEPAPEGTLRLGAVSAPVGARVDLADAALDGEPAAPPPAASAVTAELWRASATGDAAPAPLHHRTRERLRQLGYVE